MTLLEDEVKSVVKVINSSYFEKLLHTVGMRITKHSAMSEILRDTYNDQLKSERHDSDLHEKILKGYTMCIVCAEPNSEALALAYGNRSYLLSHIAKYEPCLADIERALKITNSESLKIKLLCRKIKCLKALKKPGVEEIVTEVKSMIDRITNDSLRKSFEEILSKNQSTVPAKDLKSKKKQRSYEEMLEDLNKKHKVNDFSGVEIKQNEKFGRHLVATKDFRPGEVIYIEEPYIKFLNQKKLHANCSHCFATKWANIACDHCSWAMFCSEECKEEAWNKYHDVECSVYGWSKDDESNDWVKQLAVRALIIALKQAGGIEKLKDELNAFEQETDFRKGFFYDEKIKTNGFMSMYALSDNAPSKSSVKHSENTARVLRAIAENTSYFGPNFDSKNSEEYKNNETALFLGALFYKLSKISLVNFYQMWNGSFNCTKEINRLDCWKKECCSRGVYIAPITGLINHSCDPNVRICYSKDHTVILYALMPIKKGDQIFNCYQQEYYNLYRKERRETLVDQYNFNCDCEGCLKNWPYMMDFVTFQGGVFKGGHAEMRFGIQYKNIIGTINDRSIWYDEKTLKFVGEGVEKAIKNFPRPGFTTCNLIISLQSIFERIYGLTFQVPSNCYV